MLVLPVALTDGVDAWFTGRDLDAPVPPVGAAGNLSHRRPHRPQDLVATREEVGALTDTDPRSWHLMQQVHGAEVAVVTSRTPVGAELRGVDACVTAEVGRPLAVAVADCVPVLLAGRRTVAVAHAGRRGVQAEVVPATLRTMQVAGERMQDVQAALGPAIGGCCYEVPPALRDEVADEHPEAMAETTWGTPALDLPAAVTAQLRRAGVSAVDRIGGCTHCDAEARWFSHRADPAAGRQLGLIVRRARAVGDRS